MRGLDAYRDSWPGFFDWQASGASFEIESLDVTAGADVAFAFGLLRCGTPADSSATRPAAATDDRPAQVDGRWLVTHEHHSFVDASE